MATLVGRHAPEICGPAVLSTGEVIDDFSLLKSIEGRYGLVFFYPLDFTFVCPSELIALDHRIDEFNNRGVEVVAVSIDSHFTHNAWRNTPVDQGGIGPVRYTIAADIQHRAVQAYGVEHAEAGVALRGSFLIDKSGVIRSAMVNDLPIGRNVDEILRVFDAIEFHEQHGEVCPAGWKDGDAGMSASPEGVAQYLEEHAERL